MGVPCCKQKKFKKTEEPRIETQIPPPFKITNLKEDNNDNQRKQVNEHSNVQPKKTDQLSFEQKEPNLSEDSKKSY
jgi:hypothetical protein